MKKKYLLSSIVLIFYAIIAGGSIDESFISFMTEFLTVCALLAGTGFGVYYLAIRGNKSKRLKLIDEELKSGNYNRSKAFGDDKCQFYFDSEKEQVLILRITSKAIHKSYINNFQFDNIGLGHVNAPYFCFYDTKHKNILTGDYKRKDVKYTITNLVNQEVYKDIEINNTIEPQIYQYTPGVASNEACVMHVVISECYGCVSIVRDGIIQSAFNYVDVDKVSEKTGDKSFITVEQIGNYLFIQDDFYNILVAVTPAEHFIMKYEDIIDAIYEENDQPVLSRSTLRTVTGTLIGGALGGRTGALIGGMSGVSFGAVEIGYMNINVYVRNAPLPCYTFFFNETFRELHSDVDDVLYDYYLHNVKMAQQMFFAIMDKASKRRIAKITQAEPAPTENFNMEDDLLKLVELRVYGGLTEEEFKDQTEKVLRKHYHL